MFEALRTLKGLSLEYLERNAGKDSLEDRYHVGLIAGLNSVLNMSADELIEESQDDS